MGIRGLLTREVEQEGSTVLATVFFFFFFGFTQRDAASTGNSSKI